MHADIIDPFYVDEPIDVVYHFASPASPIDYLRLPLHTLKVGSYGTHHALGLAKHHRARFLLASTSEVYGDPQIHPQPESYWGHVNPIGPRGVYDEAKRYAEALTMAYHRQQGVDTAIVRIFNSCSRTNRCSMTTGASCAGRVSPSSRLALPVMRWQRATCLRARREAWRSSTRALPPPWSTRSMVTRFPSFDADGRVGCSTRVRADRASDRPALPRDPDALRPLDPRHGRSLSVRRRPRRYSGRQAGGRDRAGRPRRHREPTRRPGTRPHAREHDRGLALERGRPLAPPRRGSRTRRVAHGNSVSTCTGSYFRVERNARPEQP